MLGVLAMGPMGVIVLYLYGTEKLAEYKAAARRRRRQLES